jgi:hypothetical protein
MFWSVIKYTQGNAFNRECKVLCSIASIISLTKPKVVILSLSKNDLCEQNNPSHHKIRYIHIRQQWMLLATLGSPLERGEGCVLFCAVLLLNPLHHKIRYIHIRQHLPRFLGTYTLKIKAATGNLYLVPYNFNMRVNIMCRARFIFKNIGYGFGRLHKFRVNCQSNKCRN